MNILGFVESVGRDLRHALRALPRRPTFTFAAVLTLALGIGATTAIFSVVYSVLIKPLPYPNSDELVRIRHSAAALEHRRSRSVADAVLHLSRREPDVRRDRLLERRRRDADPPRRNERVRSLRVTHGLLAGARRAARRGRWFTEAGAWARGRRPRPDHPLVRVRAEPVRRRRGGARARAAGQLAAGASRRRHAAPISASSICRRQFDIIVAVRLDPARAAIGGFGFQALARLKPGVTPAEASADIAAHVADLARRMADVARVQRDAAKRSRTGASRQSCGRSRTTWSAASRARCGCSWARSARCCSSRAPTSRTSCSCAPMRGGRSSPCAPRSAPCRHASRESCSSRLS